MVRVLIVWHYEVRQDQNSTERCWQHTPIKMALVQREEGKIGDPGTEDSYNSQHIPDLCLCILPH